MNVRPIIFSPPMVRAIMAGRKTETRRVVTGRVALEWLEPGMFTPSFVADPENYLCPYGNPGDFLYVRERFSRPVGGHTLYAADWPDGMVARSEAIRRKFPTLAGSFPDAVWRPSIHMPRELARLFLKVERVRCERLRSITEYEAILEGFEPGRGCAGLRYVDAGTWVSAGHPGYERGLRPSAVAEFACLWDTLNGGKKGRTYFSDPWVWAVRFSICKDPVDLVA